MRNGPNKVASALWLIIIISLPYMKEGQRKELPELLAFPQPKLVRLHSYLLRFILTNSSERQMLMQDPHVVAMHSAVHYPAMISRERTIWFWFYCLLPDESLVICMIKVQMQCILGRWQGLDWTLPLAEHLQSNIIYREGTSISIGPKCHKRTVLQTP